MDLLNMSRSSKRFRDILTTKHHRDVWTNSFELVEGLPPCPNDMSGPFYAALLFDTTCFVRCIVPLVYARTKLTVWGGGAGVWRGTLEARRLRDADAVVQDVRGCQVSTQFCVMCTVLTRDVTQLEERRGHLRDHGTAREARPHARLL